MVQHHPKPPAHTPPCPALVLLLQMNSQVSSLSLYDIAGTPGVGADISHVNTRAQVKVRMAVVLWATVCGFQPLTAVSCQELRDAGRPVPAGAGL